MAKKEKVGKVIPFPRRKAPAKDPLEGDDTARGLSKGGFIALLDSIAPAPSSLEPALKPPEKLYVVGEGPSISSDPDKSISRLSLALVRGDDVTPELLDETPDYGIHLTYRKSTSICVLLDKSRKMIVVAALGNSLGGGLDWDLVVTAINSAVEERKELEEKGEKFNLFVSRELAGETVTF